MCCPWRRLSDGRARRAAPLKSPWCRRAPREPVATSVSKPSRAPPQGRYYVSVTGVGSPVTPWGQGYTSYGSVGQYKLSLRGAWPAGAVVCKSPTLQLPQAAPGAGCGRVVLGAGDLYESEGPVSFSPDLPGVWPLGERGREAQAARVALASRAAAVAAARRGLLVGADQPRSRHAGACSLLGTPTQRFGRPATRLPQTPPHPRRSHERHF